MANRLKMAEHQAILGLVRLNWSYRRIAAELGIDRETVSRHVKAAAEAEARSSTGTGPPEANATISITGSSSPDLEISYRPPHQGSRIPRAQDAGGVQLLVQSFDQAQADLRPGDRSFHPRGARSFADRTTRYRQTPPNVIHRW